MRGTVQLACGQIDGERCPACGLIVQPLHRPDGSGYGRIQSTGKEALAEHWRIVHPDAHPLGYTGRAE